ncbi:MAG TPA: SDR family NAD(P)-dependent oxidoreductase, partial [Acidimicrobiia bacterium]|nr:SDR family NAD(P)-dependent oxidoreductase [Acidimicrobiia bacterium]
MKLEGSKILVTGASSGIGAALAPILAQRGATVGIVARRADRLEAVLERCAQHTPESRMWTVDLSDLAAAEKVALDAWDAFGGLDAVVHNAAIPKRVHMSRLTFDDVDE